MGFAPVILLVVGGLLAVPHAFTLGALLIVAGVSLHAVISPRSEDVFFAWLLTLAGIGAVVEVGFDLFHRFLL